MRGKVRKMNLSIDLALKKALEFESAKTELIEPHSRSTERCHNSHYMLDMSLVQSKLKLDQPSMPC
jgi:hypothetical protein